MNIPSREKVKIAPGGVRNTAFHKFNIIAGPTGDKAFVFMDGELLRGIKAVDVRSAVNEPALVRIEFFAASVNEESTMPMSQEEARAIAVLNDDSKLEQIIAQSLVNKNGTADPKEFRRLVLEQAAKTVLEAKVDGE